MSEISGAVAGVDHLAFVTWDPAATVEFYTQALGFPLVHAITAKGWGIDDHPDFVHFFFDIGGGNHLAFFYYFGLPPEDKVVGLMKRARHLALHVETEEEMVAYRERLMAHGVRVTRPVAHELIESIYFDDPNGIQLEITRPLRRFGAIDARDAARTVAALRAAIAEGDPTAEGMWARKAAAVTDTSAAGAR